MAPLTDESQQLDEWEKVHPGELTSSVYTTAPINNGWCKVDKDVSGNLIFSPTTPPQFVSGISNKNNNTFLEVYDFNDHNIINSQRQLFPSKTNYIHHTESNKEDDLSIDESDVSEWQVIKDDLDVILASDFKKNRKLDKTARLQTLALGVSSAALSSFTLSYLTTSFFLSLGAVPLANFLLLSSADLIRLGLKGRSPTIDLENRTQKAIYKSLAVRNTKISLVSCSTGAVVKTAFSTLTSLTSVMPLFPIILDNLPEVPILSSISLPVISSPLSYLSTGLSGIQISSLKVSESIVSGAACSVSTQLVSSASLKKVNKKLKRTKVRANSLSEQQRCFYNVDSDSAASLSLCIEEDKKKNRMKKNKKMIASAVWGATTGAVSSVVGPILSSPVTEKAVLEVCNSAANSVGNIGKLNTSFIQHK